MGLIEFFNQTSLLMSYMHIEKCLKWVSPSLILCKLSKCTFILSFMCCGTDID